jgi:hypothetical protein
MPVSEQSLIDAILHTRTQVDFLWQFFVTVQIALFALLFIYDDAVESMNGLARMLAIFSVGAFDWINGNALRGAYGLLDALHQQYRHDYGAIDRFRPALFERLVQATYEGREQLLLLTHTMAFVVFALAFLWPRFISHARRRRDETY